MMNFYLSPLSKAQFALETETEDLRQYFTRLFSGKYQKSDWKELPFDQSWLSHTFQQSPVAKKHGENNSSFGKMIQLPPGIHPPLERMASHISKYHENHVKWKCIFIYHLLNNYLAYIYWKENDHKIFYIFSYLNQSNPA